jgi:hypothetical protein
MSIGRTIIAIGVFIGISLFQKTKPKFLKVLLIGFILSFLSSFFGDKLFINFSFLLFGISVLTYFIYSLYYKSWLPGMVSVFALVSFIFQAQYWPYGSEIRAAMLIPITLFLITVFNFKKYENQISILVIIVSYEISEFINLLDYNISLNL